MNPIPLLFLRKGNLLRQITADQASALMRAMRDATYAQGLGANDVPYLNLHDCNGRQIGYVSTNGRVWLGSRKNWQSNTEVPVTGVKTVAEHEADNWADCRMEGKP